VKPVPPDDSTASFPPLADELARLMTRLPVGETPPFLETKATAEQLNQLAAGVVTTTEALFGRYLVEGKLGEGGMGAVYLVWDQLLHRRVALKVCRFPDQIALQRFLQEARAAAALQHPNICQVFDFQTVDELHCLFMPYIEGEVLRKHTIATRLLAAAEVARIVRIVALAMQAAHDAGVIHRDLKPSNILLDGRGEPVVLDFGLARRSTDSGLTVAGPMGTPAYMPPEQCAGDFTLVGPLADVYSLGVVLFELLTGTLPFAGDAGEQMAQNRFVPAPPPSSRRAGLDPRFDPIVATALAKEPARRWASMRAFADALAELTAAPPGPELTLRVIGSAVAYRPPAGWTVLKVGRRRRKPEAPDEGNDFVIRVAGNEAVSARISRHHFEIRRAPSGFVIVDRSTTGLTMNGKAVPKGVEVALGDGDLLGVAGVVELKVAISEPSTGLLLINGVATPLALASGGGVEVEASLGDLITTDG
jgi:Protein kinase domain/FHA domain